MERLHQLPITTNQVILIGSFIPLCWLGMMAVHELGHVVAATLSGGSITQIVLHPFEVSRTDVSPNPMPLFVIWTGPVVGVTLPLATWVTMKWLKSPGDYLVRFFAGFCLVANGAYLGVGSFEGIGDAGDLLRNGAAIWQLWLFGALTVPGGFLLWHRLGVCFGLGEAKGEVESWAAYLSLALFCLIFSVTYFISPRS